MKVTVTSLTNLQDELTAVSRINNNISALATAIENTLSRDGTSPNTMGASLDMNSQRIINLPVPISNTEPVRYGEFVALEEAAAGLEAAQLAAEAAQAAAEAAQAAAESSETNAANSEANASASEVAAAASALSAAGDAVAADASATAAALSETNADASAVAAALSETNADASEAAAVAAAASLATYTASWSGTSVTSNTIGTGSKSFTASTGKLWTVGAVLQISSDATPTSYMNGLVTAYDSGTGALTVNVLDTNGSGTLSDWNITIAGTRGPAGVATIADGDKGDIITSGSGVTWTIDNGAVTYAKIQNVSTTDKLLGRSTAGAGVVEEITCTSFARTVLDDTDAATARTTLELGTANSPQFTSIEVGNASDTTLSRSSAGIIAVEGVTVPLNSTTNIHTAQQIELGHASDTTLSRSSAGVLAVEGVTVPLNSITNTHTAQQIELGHASDTTLSRVSAGVVAV